MGSITRMISSQFTTEGVYILKAPMVLFGCKIFPLVIFKYLCITAHDLLDRYGVASEHNVLYQYQMHNTKNLFMAVGQTETP